MPCILNCGATTYDAKCGGAKTKHRDRDLLPHLTKGQIMLKALFGLAFALSLALVTTTAEAQQPLSSSRNIFGGFNYSNGSVSTPNVSGGFNTVSRSGAISSSTPNVFGGSNFSNGGYTMPTAGGGMNYVAPRGGITTYTPNIFGGFNSSSGGFSKPNIFRGFDFFRR